MHYIINTHHLDGWRMKEFVFLQLIAIAESCVALQATVLTGAGDRDRGRRRRRLRRGWPCPTSAVQMFFKRSQVQRFPAERTMMLLLLLVLMILIVFEQTFQTHAR